MANSSTTLFSRFRSLEQESLPTQLFPALRNRGRFFYELVVALGFFHALVAFLCFDAEGCIGAGDQAGD